MEHIFQEPTHNNLRVTSSADARAILYLVECSLLEPVKRRPDDTEKAGIGHGSVFVWLDGAKGETGLEVGPSTLSHGLSDDTGARPRSVGQMDASGLALGAAT